MKILHYIPTYAPAWQWGGPVRSVSTLCEELAQRGHEVTVFTTDAGLQPTDIPKRSIEVIRNGVRVFYFPRVPGIGIKSPQLEHAVRDRAKEFDLIHITAIWQRTGPAACGAARAAGVPYVISPRGALGPYSWTRGTVKKLAYYFLHERQNLRNAAGFHYTSTMEAAECERFRFCKPACTVPNGIDLSKWIRNEAAGAAWRKAQGIAPEAKVLLYTGRLHHKKGLDLLLQILKELPDELWQMVFVGEDDDGSGRNLKAAFFRMGLSERVRFLSGVDSDTLQGVYSGANIFVLPSLHENFGNVAVEAAACGCWVLASDKVGVAQELTVLGVGECLPREATVWASAIERDWRAGAEDFSRGDRLARAFGIQATAESMDDFYVSLLTTGPRHV